MIWRFRDIDPRRAEQLARDLGQPRLVGDFLAARRFSAADEVRAFLRADLKTLPSPLTLTDMDKAAARLLDARRRGEVVAVCGDYDADGLTASAVLLLGLKELGLEVLSRIPNRLADGYGLKPEAVLDLARQGVTLIVTVDNGISDFEAVAAAARAGLDVIITDHHQLPPELPPALAIIDPHRDPIWRDAPPAGVGVAFLLLTALKRRFLDEGLLAPGAGPALLEDYLPLVAIGTIADLAPLTGPNRVLVRHGLSFLASVRHPGLAALKKISISRQGSERVTPWDVGFRLAPRLNAAGRLGRAEPALELLLAEDEDEAARLAARLEDLNRERHQGQNSLCAEALERLELEISPDSRTVVLAGEGWPRGLLGLAASRVAEATRKPTVLFSLEDNGLAVGSGRSAGNFNLYRALDGLRDLFISFGGHAQAAGMTLQRDLLDEFRAGLETAAQEEPDFQTEPELLIDLAAASLGDLEAVARPLAALEPFGQGHPPPLVALRRARVTEARPTDRGGAQHLKMVLSEGLTRLTVVGFGLAPRQGEVTREMDLALMLESAEYKGQSVPNWRLVDFRQPEEASA